MKYEEVQCKCMDPESNFIYMSYMRVKIIATFVATFEAIKKGNEKYAQSPRQLPCGKHKSALASSTSIFERTLLV